MTQAPERVHMIPITPATSLTQQFDILVVDHSVENLQGLAATLTEARYQVLTATDGEQALKIFDDRSPALVLLDVQMPGMDGFEVCRRIKSHVTHPSVPVILLSDLDDSATRLEGFKAGAVDFIGKPFVMQEVLSRIAVRLALWQSRRELQQQLEQTRTLNRQLIDAQFQLLQSEKLASIGQLAAGVAHELNNPIGFVHSNLGTLDGYLHDLMEIIGAYAEIAASPGVTAQQRQAMTRLLEERDYAYLKGDIFNLVTESKDGLDRVRKIVANLKSFSRVGEQEWQDADLHQGIESTLSIVWNELKYKCKVVKDFGDIPPVFCLISQINQVILNLLVNASHAIERDGTITIRTRRHDEATVSLEIIDTGCGIAPELLGRIFEPFFTTKPVGKGTGLGLSLSYGIVQRHKGRIEVDSQPGVGSTFRLLLPIHGKPDHAAA